MVALAGTSRRTKSRTAAVVLLCLAVACGLAAPLAHAVPTPIAISATSFNFGAVNVGQTATRTLTVTNTHASAPFGPINMFGGAPPTAQFNASQNCQGRTLAAGASCSITYTFTPSGRGTFTDTSSFTISATSSQSDGEDFSVALSGSGVLPISASPLNHNFGTVAIGATATASTVITNTGSQSFGPINMFGGAPPTAQFNASQNCQGRTLAPGATCSITYTFTPSARGTFNDTSSFTISPTSSQADGENFSVTLSGRGGNPIAVSPVSHSFGNVAVGATATASTTITNTGAQPFGPINMFGGAPPTPQYNASQNCQGRTLAPGASCSITYTFTPSGRGAFTDSSVFTISPTSSQSDGDDFTVALSGSGINPITASPLQHDFGNVAVGATATATTLVRNTGAQPFGPINMFGGAPPTPQFDASQNCQGATLAPGGSCTITYRFTPTGGGRFSDASRFTISATPQQSAGTDFVVQLTGCGVSGASCPAAVTTTTLACTPNPAARLQTVTCTATVSASGATPAGSVAFTVDGSPAATATLDGNARARFSTSSLAPGSRSIVARYVPGSPNFLASTSSPLVVSVVVGEATVTAVEYFHAQFGYYFITSFTDEIAALDGGAFGGAWQRTGQTFRVWENHEAGTSPVCRFFSASFAPRSSHFYTPFANECETVKANPDWQFEAISFYLKVPTAAGSCPVGSAPLFRLYNDGMGGAPNHRYTTRNDIAQQMIALGWIPEGFGGAAVFACIPSL